MIKNDPEAHYLMMQPGDGSGMPQQHMTSSSSASYQQQQRRGPPYGGGDDTNRVPNPLFSRARRCEFDREVDSYHLGVGWKPEPGFAESFRVPFRFPRGSGAVIHVVGKLPLI